MKNLVIFLVALGYMFLLSCEGSTTSNTQEETPEETTETTAEVEETTTAPTIVSVAAGNENFSTLVTAVKAAGLVDVLNGDGPFTVFAPINDAFAKLPEGTVEGLLQPEAKEKLTDILTYHVVAGEFKAADVINAINKNNGAFTIPTVQGGSLTATLVGDKVVITDGAGNKSTVVMADVAASNGVIHAIDVVVMP